VNRDQQPDGGRRIGVLMSFAATDPEAPIRVAAFLQGLQELGWTDGRSYLVDAHRKRVDICLQ
jgi:hypothetical protein